MTTASEMKSRSNLIIVGSGRLTREALAAMLSSRDFAVHEGAKLVDACYSRQLGFVPDAIIYLMSASEVVEDVLAQLCQAQDDFPGVKTVLIALSFTSAEVSRVLHTRVDAVLSPDISGRLFANSLELVLLGQHLFPATRLPVIENGRTIASTSIVVADHERKQEATDLPLVTEFQPSNGEMMASIRHSGSIETPPFDLRSDSSVSDSSESLTFSDRETQILRCLVDGSPNKVIARALGIAETTVKVHVKGLLRKVRVANRTQAAVWALNNYFNNRHV